MSDMVKRVAAAICMANASESNNYDELARAAIKAMRMPTDDMLDAGCYDDISQTIAGWIWADMIDAALAKVPA